jgi:SAM-dependent methyltransferase
MVHPHFGGLDHYLAVGRSAIELVARAMIGAGVSNISSLMDLPCGGGRVTRHFRTFFPEAELYVGELNQHKLAFVVEEFKAHPIVADPNFTLPLREKFDLIFVGSLVTHFPADRFRRAVKWFTQALVEDGICIITTHGRYSDYFQRDLFQYIEPAKWANIFNLCEATGFGYAPYDGYGGDPRGASYGISLSSPAWLMRLAQSDPEMRIISFQERAWAGHQDALILQRRHIGYNDPAWDYRQN